ncbi:MAG: CvpA family protein [Planctomycetaceae bacterium]
MTLTWFDFLVIGVLIFTTFRGLQRGFVWQLAWIAALVLCFGFAESFSIKLAPKIQEFAPQAKPPLDRWIAMLVLYLGFSFLSFGVARVLHGWIEKAKFKEYDRHLGGLFGFVKGVLICLVGTFFIITLSERARETVLGSKSGRAAAIVMNQLEPVLPKELAQILEPYMLKLDPNHSHDGDLDSGQLDPFGGSADDFLFGNTDQNAGDIRDQVEDAAQSGGGALDGLWDQIRGAGQGSGTNSDNGPIANGGGSNAPATLEGFIRALPTSMSRELKQSAADAYRNATPEQREQLVNQVQSSLPEEVGNVLGRFQQLRNGWNELNRPTENAPSQASRDNLLTQISEIFSDREGARVSFREKVNQRLTGVPGSVASAVLADWQADLKASGDDPDPTTNYKTSFDVRLYRQLQSAGVPIERLSQSLQERMQNVSRQ